MLYIKDSLAYRIEMGFAGINATAIRILWPVKPTHNKNHMNENIRIHRDEYIYIPNQAKPPLSFQARSLDIKILVRNARKIRLGAILLGVGISVY